MSQSASRERPKTKKLRYGKDGLEEWVGTSQGMDKNRLRYR